MKGWVKLQLIDGTDKWVRPGSIVAINLNDNGTSVDVILIVGAPLVTYYLDNQSPTEIQEAIDDAGYEILHRRPI